MADYAFLTTWLLESPREPVFEAIYDQASWPQLVARGGGGRGAAAGRRTSGVGTVSRMVWKSLLPYRVEFEVTTTRVERPHLLEGRRGRRADRGRPLAPLRAGRRHRRPLRVERGDDQGLDEPLAPLARPVFEWNHDWVMARGGEGIAHLLGCRLLASG